MINRDVRNRALNILENGTQAQYQDEAVKEYLEAKTIAIDSIKKLNKIEQIVNDWKESLERDIEMYDTLEEITKILEQE